MTFMTSKELIKHYATSKKNPDYQLDFLLSSIDLNTCNTCLSLVEVFKLSGDAQAVILNDDNLRRIEKLFGRCDNSLITQLLWVALMLPEI